MEKLALFLILLVVFSGLSTSKANGPLAPALYIFGDSIVDGGNNIWMNNNPMYGIDLNEGESPPRWTNGKTQADFIALSLGLPLVPPISLPVALESTTGINFAYGASCMFPESNSGQKPWALLPTRLDLFNITVAQHLTKTFGNRLQEHLEKSIFLISIGINDFANTTLDRQVLAKNLLTGMSQTLTSLHALGARKFLVNNVWPLGCAPGNLIDSKTSCNETLNQHVLLYDNSLPETLKELQTKLPGTIISHSDNFQFFNDLKSNTAKYGITNFTGGCYPTGKNQCERHVYVDDLHMTQATNAVFAQECFSGTICTPNIATLVNT